MPTLNPLLESQNDEILSILDELALIPRLLYNLTLRQLSFNFLRHLKQTTSFLLPADNVSRWERTVNDEEEKLETCRRQEAKQRDDIDKDLQQVEQLKATRLNKKQEVEAADEEVGRARREVGAVAKDAQAAQKAVVALEGKIEGKKSERHNILMQCKVSGDFFLGFL